MRKKISITIAILFFGAIGGYIGSSNDIQCKELEDKIELSDGSFYCGTEDQIKILRELPEKGIIDINCTEYDNAIDYKGFKWCINNIDLELEKVKNINKIKNDEIKNNDSIKALMNYDNEYKKLIRKSIVDEFELEKDDEFPIGKVSPNNLFLHIYVINEYYEELSDSNNLPDWYYNSSQFTNEEIIEKIHTSLKNT